MKISLWRLRKLSSFIKISKLTYSKLESVVKNAEKVYDITKIRNVGVIAHIDAGKTTTSERMLYYSGFSSFLGNIDDGNTVTDFMRQERERGISITSALVSFAWKQHNINLIDTPGHIDFTSEVECSLRVLDGAVLILDASAGVEAQTMAVWRQARKYHIPMLAFVNKMDKHTASLAACIHSILHKLCIRPLPLQEPVYVGGCFEGVVDLIGMRKYTWQAGGDGREFKVEEVVEVEGGEELWQRCVHSRRKLLEELANLDEEVGERYLQDSELRGLSEQEVRTAVARVTQACRAVPVLCGSSLRNKGVQLLMDAMLTHLPDPLHHDLLLQGSSQHPWPEQQVLAFAFKTIHHSRTRQALTFLRLHSGSLRAPCDLHNCTQDVREKVDKLLQIRADEYTQLSDVTPGMIFAVSGLKHTNTGDLLVSPSSTSHSDQPCIDVTQIPLSTVPEPVYFCSIEPPTLAAQRGLDEALACLCREDPSLKVRVDAATGQTVLGGMGKLHLEVVRDRIFQEFKIDADLGELTIAYQESMQQARKVKLQVDKVISGCKNSLTAVATFHPVCQEGDDVSKNPLLVDSTLHWRPCLKVSLVLAAEKRQRAHFSVAADADSHLSRHPLKAALLKPIQEGLSSAFSKGALLGYPVCRVHMQLNELVVSHKTSLAFVSSCFSRLASQALTKDNSLLLQPLMRVEVVTTAEMLSTVLSDLAQRDSSVLDVCRSSGDDAVVVVATTPLANMADFSTTLRTKTRGLASFSMALSSYEAVSEKSLLQLLH